MAKPLFGFPGSIIEGLALGLQVDLSAHILRPSNSNGKLTLNLKSYYKISVACFVFPMLSCKYALLHITNCGDLFP